MKRNIDIDERLYKVAKSRAESDNKSVDEVIEDALRKYLRASLPFDLKWVTMRGELMPGVDLQDLDSLYDHIYGLGKDN